MTRCPICGDTPYVMWLHLVLDHGWAPPRTLSESLAERVAMLTRTPVGPSLATALGWDRNAKPSPSAREA